MAAVSPDNFPLLTGLAEKLRRLCSTLHDGRGFAVISRQGQSDEDNVIAFCGIGSYVDRTRCANEDGGKPQPRPLSNCGSLQAAVIQKEWRGVRKTTWLLMINPSDEIVDEFMLPSWNQLLAEESQPDARSGAKVENIRVGLYAS